MNSWLVRILLKNMEFTFLHLFSGDFYTFLGLMSVPLNKHEIHVIILGNLDGVI